MDDFLCHADFAFNSEESPRGETAIYSSVNSYVDIPESKELFPEYSRQKSVDQNGADFLSLPPYVKPACHGFNPGSTLSYYTYETLRLERKMSSQQRSQRLVIVAEGLLWWKILTLSLASIAVGAAPGHLTCENTSKGCLRLSQ